MKKSKESMNLNDDFIKMEIEEIFVNRFEKIFNPEDLKKDIFFSNGVIIKILELKCLLEKEKSQKQKCLKCFINSMEIDPAKSIIKYIDENIKLCNIILSKKKLNYLNFQNYLFEIEKNKLEYKVIEK
jgi:hypothetical protein